MKKQFLVAGFAVITAIAASAQTKEDNIPPPPPPPPVERMKEVPPPPPPPPAVPRPPATPDAPPPPPVEAVEMQGDLDQFLKRNPDVKSVEWTRADAIIIQLKNGKKETYNLNDEKSVGSAETKYGKLPIIPPPPPPAPPPPKRSRTLS